MLDTAEASQPRPLAELARGLAEYREGQFAAAAERLEQVANKEPNDNAKAQAHLVLAMAKSRLGQPSQVEAPKPSYGSADWNEQTITQLLADELTNNAAK